MSVTKFHLDSNQTIVSYTLLLLQFKPELYFNIPFLMNVAIMQLCAFNRFILLLLLALSKAAAAIVVVVVFVSVIVYSYAVALFVFFLFFSLCYASFIYFVLISIFIVSDDYNKYNKKQHGKRWSIDCKQEERKSEREHCTKWLRIKTKKNHCTFC